MQNKPDLMTSRGWQMVKDKYPHLPTIVRDRIRARDGFTCQMCNALYHGHLFGRFETHHFLSTTNCRRLRLPKEVMDDPRNLIYLCLDCHILTYNKKARLKDPQSSEKFDRLEARKREIGYYEWRKKIELFVPPKRKQLLFLPRYA
ncbi:hypothetical protein ES703_124879 [subsurface metagenome]